LGISGVYIGTLKIKGWSRTLKLWKMIFLFQLGDLLVPGVNLPGRIRFHYFSPKPQKKQEKTSSHGKR